MDARKYLDLFLSEAREHLDQIARIGRELSASSPPESLHALFRSFHSLKGMAASMEFKSLSELAHAVEDLYDQARQGKRAIDAELSEITLDAVDLITTLIDEIVANGQSSSSTEDLTARVRALLAGTAPSTGVDNSPGGGGSNARDGGEGVPAPQAPPSGAQPAASGDAVDKTSASSGASAGTITLEVHFGVSTGAPLPAARAMVALKRLQTLGAVDQCDPDPAQWAGSAFAGKVKVRLQSSLTPEAIIREITALADISTCQVNPTEKTGARPASAAVRPASSTIRVRTDVLDRLMDGVGDMLVASALVEQQLPRSPASTPVVQRLKRALTRLHDDVLELRMVPFDFIAQRFYQSVRHLAQNLRKKASLEISGADVRMDRAMLEELVDPLNHIIRNAIDHGVEDPEQRAAAGKPVDGRIRLALERQGEVVRVRLSDDGRGMDPARIREAAVRKGFVTEDHARALSEEDALMLTTIPGFSTADKLSEISGRGVGMDVVRTRIESLGGHMRILSRFGEGTEIEMVLPLTVAVIDSLLLRLGSELYAVPIHSVQQTLEVHPDQVQYSNGNAVLRWANHTVNLKALRALLGEGDAGAWSSTCPTVVYEAEGQMFGLGVDSVIGKRPIVVKPLKSPLENLREYSGATVLEDGKIALILDLANLAGM